MTQFEKIALFEQTYKSFNDVDNLEVEDGCNKSDRLRKIGAFLVLDDYIRQIGMSIEFQKYVRNFKGPDAYRRLVLWTRPIG